MKTKILNLIDFNKVDTLLEGFNQTTGFVTAILDLDGNVLSKSGWRQICTEFHRINPDTSKKCTISDTILAGQLAADKKYHFYKCLNGLIDVAVPIVIKGEHIANLFSGQFFFEEPNELLFKEQAKKHGFDEERYLEALRKVPVISEVKVKVAMEFLLNMTLLISEMAFQKLEQTALNEELRTSEERYRLVLENSMDAILLMTTDGVILSANQAACAIFQRSEEDICRIGRNGIVDKSDPRLAILIEERKKTGKAKGELLMLRNDGTKFPVELSSSLYSDKSGQQRISIIIRDITERMQTEAALKLSEEKFNKAFNNSPDAIIITNVSDGKIIDANETFFKLSGYEREHAIGSSSLLLNLWNNPDDRLAYVTLLKKHGSVKDFETKFITSSGEVRDYFISGEAFTLNGEYCILGVLRDITQWKLTRENVNRLNRVYTILSNLNQTIVRTRNQQQLFNEACRIAVDKGEFLMAWIGIVNTTTNKVDVIASYGKATEYLNDINIDLNDAVQSSGPTGMAVKTGESIFSNNIETDEKMIPWRKKALMQGFLSSITLPIKVSGKIIGAYTMYAGEPDCFNEDEIKLLEEMASDISYALEFIESEKRRELAEEELEKNNSLLQSILEGTSDAIYIKNTAGKYILLNKAALLITGKTGDEVLGKDDTFLFPTKEADTVMQGDLKILAERKTVTLEEDLTTQNGEVRTFLSTKGPIFNKSGHLIGVFGVTRDITERKLAEETLRANEERYRLISEVVSDYIFTSKIDKEGKLGLRWVTGAFERITGYSFDEYIAHGGWRAALHPDDIEKDNQDIEELKKNNKLVTDVRTLAKDGRIIWVRVYAHPIWDYQNNKLVGIYGGVKDITESKLAEEALIQANSELEQLQNNLDEAVFSVDTIHNKMLYVSKAHQTVFGQAPIEFFNNPQLWYDIILPEDKHIVDAGYPVLYSGKNLHHQYRIAHPNGEIHWVEAKMNPTLDENGKLTRVDGVAYDITSRKMIETELLESEINFRRSISDSPVGIRIVSEDEDTVYANKAFLDMYEFSSLEEFTSTPAKVLYTPESYIFHQERKKKRNDGVDASDYEISINCKNGDIRHVKVARKEILWNGKKHFQVINQDITKQRKAEEELRKLSIAVEQSPNAECITDTEGIIEYINPTMSELTGYTQEELLGKKTNIFSSVEKTKKEYDELWKTIKSGNVWKGELHNKKKNGELYWESTTISPIFDKTGKITHFLAIKVDISERKRVETALLNSEEQLRKFASHLQNIREEEKIAIAREIHDDLGQLLVALQIDAGLLKNKVIKIIPLEDTEIQPKFDNLVALIKKSIKTARNIMNDLRPALLEMHGLVGATKEYLREFEDRHRISCEFEDDIHDVKMTPQQSLALFRILQEAMNNIVKHAKATLVRVQLQSSDNKIILQITDNGVGFDKNNSGREDSYGMIGMKERIILLEGTLDITSKVGHGTTVQVGIPNIAK